MKNEIEMKIIGIEKIVFDYRQGQVRLRQAQPDNCLLSVSSQTTTASPYLWRHRQKLSVGVLLLSFLLQSCDFLIKPQVSIFTTIPENFPIENGIVDEASGIVASRAMSNRVWIHEDGGNPPNLFLFSNQGEMIGKMTLPIENRDWEDIAIGPGPETGKNYIYLGEIGDNLAVYDEYAIYRFEEPTNLTTTPAIEKIAFVYPDGKYNAETLLLDPLTKDLYIVTKHTQKLTNERVYRLPYPQSTSEQMTAEFVGTLPIFIATGGDISADGSEILIKNYGMIYYWKKKKNETLIQTLARNYDSTPSYTIEVQGEAIGFDAAATGFFTISERNGQAVKIPLYFYKKI